MNRTDLPREAPSGRPQGDVEERLARSERLLAEAQRVAHVGSWEWDVSRNTVTWTDELYRIFGDTERTFGRTYESFIERVHPDDRGHTRDVVFEAFRATKPFIYDHRIIRLDGAVRMLHTQGDVITDASGKPERLVGSCWDVTERWEAEQNRDRSLSLLHATLDSTGDGIFVVDLEQQIISFNKRALDLWEIPEKLARERDVWAFIEYARDLVADPDDFLRHERELLSDRETVSLDTIRFKDGRVFERYSQPQKLGGVVVGRVCSFRDVTERERLLRSALFLADASRLLASIDMEQALEAVAQLSLPLLGDACAIDLFTEGGGPRRLLSLTLPPCQPVTADLPRSVLTGSSSVYACGTRSCMAVPLTARGAVVGAVTFIAAAQRRYERSDLELAEELSRRMALAIENARLFRHSQEALRARDEFFAIASHEIRGPIASLHLAVQNLGQSKDPATIAKLVATIERADRRLARFVDELFDVTQIRVGRLRFELEDVDLAEVTREVVSRSAPELTRSGSSLSMTTRGDLWGVWDRQRVEQIVSNLLSNAIKFGLGAPIEVRLEGDAEKARLVVSDQGVGIPAERRDAIFEPFERASAARHYGGLGLGLYITRTIVLGLGGVIRVEGGREKGVIFTVELPKVRTR